MHLIENDTIMHKNVAPLFIVLASIICCILSTASRKLINSNSLVIPKWN